MVLWLAFLFCFLNPRVAKATSSPEVVDITTSPLIEITEFYANPLDGNEWVEVYNPNDNELDISGWYLDDIEGGKTGSPYIIPEALMAPYSCLSLDFPGSGILNNGKDEVRILDSKKQVVVALSYENVKSGNSISLINEIWEFSSPTKSCPTLQVGQQDTSKDEEGEEVEEEVNYPDNIKITEFMACPKKDEGEWIEIYNDTGEELDLTGWEIDDVEGGGSSPLSLSEEEVGKELIVGKDSYFVIPISSSRFNNTGGDSVRLLNPNGDLVDETSYDNCKTGYSFALDGGEFKLTKTPTPGEENKIVEDEVVVEGEEAKEETGNTPVAEIDGQVLSVGTSNPDIKIPETFEIKEGVSEVIAAAEGTGLEPESAIVEEQTQSKNLNFLFIIIPFVYAGIMVYIFRVKIYGLWKKIRQHNI